ncbi:hypothetical protein [Nocardia brasiliensis]|uniref:hypothetical protein n=1 Tax=Nocardia brasiliensis TaxID=37326 RepID=UPI003D8C8BD0
MDSALGYPTRATLLSPTVESVRAARSAPVDAEPPSIMQHDHLEGIRAGATGRYLGVITRISAPLRLTALTRAVTEFVHDHDGLRTWFEPTRTGYARHVIEAAAVSFHSYDLPSPPDGDWASALTGHFDATTSPLRWPTAAFAALPGDGSFEVVFAVDPAFGDGLAQALAAYELTDRYRGQLEHRPSVSFVDHTEYVTDRNDRRIVDELFPRWERTLPRLYSRWEQPLTPPPPNTVAERPGSARVADRGAVESSVLLDSELTAAFDQVLARTGTEVPAALFTVLALTDFDLTGSEIFWSMTAPTLPFGDRFRAGGGWCTNFVPIWFELESAPTFTSTLACARAALERGNRVSGTTMPSDIYQLWTRAYRSDGTEEPSLVTILDLRVADNALGPDADTRIFSTHGTNSCISIWLARTGSEYVACAGGPDQPESRAQTDHYICRLRQIMVAVARNGDHRSTYPITGGAVAR